MELGYVILWFGIAAAAGLAANARGRDGLGWFMLGVFFSIFALIVVFILPSKKKDSNT